MSAKPLPVDSIVRDDEETDPVAAAFDNAPFMEPTPAMLQAATEITEADGAVTFAPHDEVMRRLQEQHLRK